MSERILAFGAAEEFSEGSGRLDLGFGVSIILENGAVVLKGQMVFGVLEGKRRRQGRNLR